MTTNPTENKAALAQSSALNDPAPATFSYPVALDVTGRMCVVVGGGAVGERKAGALAGAGALVTVIAPQATPIIETLASEGMLKWRAEPFIPSLLDELGNVFLLIAATDNPAVNAAARDAAREGRILFNAAAPLGDETDGEGGDFATMASVRRGDLLIAVTTGGAGPALSARLKRQISERFGPEWEPYVRLLAQTRREAKAQIGDANARADALRRVASNDMIFSLIQAGDTDGARKEATQCLLR